MVIIRLLLGLLGGIVATGPMTVAMVEWHRRLPAHQRHPLPPREITKKVAQALGWQPHLDQSSLQALTLVNHFAYGGAAGILYAVVAPVKGSPFLKGASYGLFVWMLSYLGLLPALNVLKPATQHAKERNALMVGVHLIWGIILGVFCQVMLDESRRPQSALAGKSWLPHRDA